MNIFKNIDDNSTMIAEDSLSLANAFDVAVIEIKHLMESVCKSIHWS